MEKDRRLLAAAIFALAAAYFLTNLHKAIPQPVGGEGDDGGVFIYNTVTGDAVYCKSSFGISCRKAPFPTPKTKAE